MKPPKMLTLARVTARKPMISLKPTVAGAGGDQCADDDDRGDGVGDAHQRRVQRRRHPPDHVVADEDRQHEDRQADDQGESPAACSPARRPAVCVRLLGQGRDADSTARCALSPGRSRLILSKSLVSHGLSVPLLARTRPRRSWARLRRLSARPAFPLARRPASAPDAPRHRRASPGALDDLVLPVDRQRLALLVDQISWTGS